MSENSQRRFASAALIAFAVVSLLVIAYMRMNRLEHFGPANTPLANPADIGISMPNTVLDYTDWPGAPDYCRQPSQLLDELRQAVLDAGAVRDARFCSAAVVADPTTGPVLSLTCPLSTETKGCIEVYTARLWVERNQRSLLNHKVRGFGWVQRTCDGSQAMYETLMKNMSRGTSSALEAVLGPCRPAAGPGGAPGERE